MLLIIFYPFLSGFIKRGVELQFSVDLAPVHTVQCQILAVFTLLDLSLALH